MVVPTIIEPKKVGRNEHCHCGSGEKYKKCCMPKAEVNQKLTQAGMWAIFRKLIKENEEGKIEITYNELKQIPVNEAITSNFDIDQDKFTLSVVKFKKSNIVTKDKRIIA